MLVSTTKSITIIKNQISQIDEIKNLAVNDSTMTILQPYGSKGKPDHQAKVDELAKKAKDENPGM